MAWRNTIFEDYCDLAEATNCQQMSKWDLSGWTKYLLSCRYDCFLYILSKAWGVEECGSGFDEVVDFLWLAVWLENIWNRFERQESHILRETQELGQQICRARSERSSQPWQNNDEKLLRVHKNKRNFPEHLHKMFHRERETSQGSIPKNKEETK